MGGMRVLSVSDLGGTQSRFVKGCPMCMNVSGQLPVGQFTVGHPLVLKRRSVQPPARAVLGLANPQPTKPQSGHLIVGAPQPSERISMILVTQLFECPNNWVTRPPFSGLGIGKTKDCPGWRLDQLALDDWQVRNHELTDWQMTSCASFRQISSDVGCDFFDGFYSAHHHFSKNAKQGDEGEENEDAIGESIYGDRRMTRLESNFHLALVEHIGEFRKNSDAIEEEETIPE
ncbi:unnamed protein product [Notodromas monacha]|uniref:Uncharacterized protein n=1 Tax=Notodromas monacha TaxID=399045 RepID=A0A7R9GHE2_9CRUS|nr:unnamed protein product [Notodromas monacha]CAG0920823.1 unnamed protein product [Notodromas monacha]